MLIRSTVAALLMLAASGSAQQGPRPHFRGMGGARFLGAEPGMPGRLVKNAPYSADVVTETTQTLPDGNHIRQTATARVYRDSEGRTRREQRLNDLGGLAPNSNLPEVVFINDPVAGANYAVNPGKRTATRMAWMRQGGGTPNGTSRAMMRRGGPADSSDQRPRGFGRGDNANIKTESLGRQTIEGVQADGSRTTMTIPAGQIGNEQPLQIVTETWYSPDLQTIVLSKRTDPRSGETVVRLSNVSRAEPPHTLFEVPADYTITDAPHPRAPIGRK